MLIAFFIKACKGDINDFNLSRSTVRRARPGSRLEISQAIMRDKFHTPPKNIALQWDGWLIQDRLGNKHEALAILVSAAPDHSEGKLLGVQKLANASGKQQARASFEILQKWQLVEEVVALVFDTTSSNSDWRNVAAQMLECFLEKKFSIMLAVTTFMNLLSKLSKKLYSVKKQQDPKILILIS